MFPKKDKILASEREPAHELAPVPAPALEPVPARKLEPAPEPAPVPEPTKYKTSKLKLRKIIKDKIITAEKDKNYGLFWKYFNHQNLSYLLKDLLEAKQAKNEEF